VKAAITTEQHGFDVVEVPDPTPGPDEVVIRVAACGICGSDIKAQPYMPAGMIMGHELCGEIVGFGSEAGRWRDGTNVAVLPVVSCGRCRYCVALVEPFAVGLHGVHSAEVSRGDNVLVVGAGGVGLTTIAWARARGAERVTAADPDQGRRKLAMVMGATDVLASASEAEADGYDVAIECVGRPELRQPSQSAVRRLGRAVISGACAETIGIEPVTALLKELTIRFSVCYRPDEFREVIDCLRTGAIDPAPMLGPTSSRPGRTPKGSQSLPRIRPCSAATPAITACR
jgi:threonine dehydrogenase-like Zn-dependent dehydrogenase